MDQAAQVSVAFSLAVLTSAVAVFLQQWTLWPSQATGKPRRLRQVRAPAYQNLSHGRGGWGLVGSRGACVRMHGGCGGGSLHFGHHIWAALPSEALGEVAWSPLGNLYYKAFFI